jgi:hypothetical protein
MRCMLLQNRCNLCFEVILKLVMITTIACLWDHAEIAMIVAGCISFGVLVSDDVLHLLGCLRASSGQVHTFPTCRQPNLPEACFTTAYWKMETAVTSLRQCVYCATAISDALCLRIQRSEVSQNVANSVHKPRCKVSNALHTKSF